MNLVKQSKRIQFILFGIALVLNAVLCCVYLSHISEYFDVFALPVLFLFTVCQIGILIVIVKRVFTKDFEQFYHGLASDEQFRLDCDAKTMSKDKRILFMRKYLVFTDGINVKAMWYHDITEVSDAGKVVTIKGKDQKQTIVVAATPKLSMEFMLNMLKIGRERFQN